MKKYHLHTARILLGAIIAFILLPYSVDAASLSLSANSSALPVGQTVMVTISLDTQGEIVNAINATLHFPSQKLEFQGARDGNSVFNFWVEPPYLSTNDSISFSGITPGGFSIAQGNVTTLLFSTKAEGPVNFTLDSVELLRNDGVGSAIPVSNAVLSFSVDNSATPSVETTPVDTTSPQEFTVQLGRNNDIEFGKWFVVFAAQDKESGIHHYEVAERRGSPLKIGQNDDRLEWREAVSPYVLQDQSLKSTVYVRAIDRSGNDRVVHLAPTYALEWYENYQVWGILVIVLISAVILGYVVWRLRVRRK